MKVKAKGHYWSPKKRAVAVTLRQEGYTYDQIAKRIGGGADKSGVYRVCLKFEQFGTVKDLSKTGRKKITTANDDRMIARIVMKDRGISSKQVAGLLNSSGVKVSGRTVRRRLCRVGLKSRIPRKKPYLNLKQRQKRVAWAKEHSTWTCEQWSTVIFSDETKISIFGSDGIKYIRRRSGEEHLPQCTIPTMKHPLSIMIWGCMSAMGIGRIKVLDGTVNAQTYINEVLDSKLFHSAADMFGRGKAFLFQQDGAPCHTAKATMKWFKDNNIQVLSWPGNSPDLNPIENLWPRLKRLVSQKRPCNRTQLIEAVISSWHHTIQQEELKTLVDSMPRRCLAVIKARGYPTKY